MNTNTNCEEGECKQCGVCCRLFYINLSEEEYLSGKFKTIFEGLEVPKQYDEAAQWGANFLAKKDDGSCIYLESNSCSIHKKRPEVCKGFFCNLESPEHAEMKRVVNEARLVRNQ